MKTIAEIFRSYDVVDEQGRHVNGTDKHGPNHQYGFAYEAIFPNRPAIKLMLEVGVADGSSLLAWREVFPFANVVGMDIHVSQRAVEHGIEFHIGDQRSQEDCQRVAHGRQFDVIVEDAWHSTDNSLLCLFWLWPFVRPGGIYVVEEWAGIASARSNIMALFPFAEIIDTQGPFGGLEQLVVLRKPLS